MIHFDHLAVWTDQRDSLLAGLCAAARLDAVDGYAPEGNVVARGVRFANGPFLDVHQAPPPPEGGRPFHRLLGLRGEVDQVERQAAAAGLRSKAQRRREAADPSREAPWDILSFRRRQGVASQLFVIQYAPGAATPQDFAAPLYDPGAPGTGAATLARVWIPESDLDSARATLAALGAREVGPAKSRLPPYEGRGFDLGATQLVLSRPWASVSSVRLDIEAEGPRPAALSPLPEVAFVVNERL